MPSTPSREKSGKAWPTASVFVLICSSMLGILGGGGVVLEGWGVSCWAFLASALLLLNSWFLLIRSISLFLWAETEGRRKIMCYLQNIGNTQNHSLQCSQHQQLRGRDALEPIATDQTFGDDSEERWLRSLNTHWLGTVWLVATAGHPDTHTALTRDKLQ